MTTETSAYLSRKSHTVTFSLKAIIPSCHRWIFDFISTAGHVWHKGWSCLVILTIVSTFVGFSLYVLPIQTMVLFTLHEFHVCASADLSTWLVALPPHLNNSARNPGLTEHIGNQLCDASNPDQIELFIWLRNTGPSGFSHVHTETTHVHTYS